MTWPLTCGRLDASWQSSTRAIHSSQARTRWSSSPASWRSLGCLLPRSLTELPGSRCSSMHMAILGWCPTAGARSVNLAPRNCNRFSGPLRGSSWISSWAACSGRHPSDSVQKMHCSRSGFWSAMQSMPAMRHLAGCRTHLPPRGLAEALQPTAIGVAAACSRCHPQAASAAPEVSVPPPVAQAPTSLFRPSRAQVDCCRRRERRTRHPSKDLQGLDLAPLV
mmetsp:Transcript_5943/g.13940  ORF Transcript_5943/g.13940 Transcript_5943/m.13940 type:complete len:222 (-) Transcript_5943:179-844(-)